MKKDILMANCYFPSIERGSTYASLSTGIAPIGPCRQTCGGPCSQPTVAEAGIAGPVVVRLRVKSSRIDKGKGVISDVAVFVQCLRIEEMPAQWIGTHHPSHLAGEVPRSKVIKPGLLIPFQNISDRVTRQHVSP